MNNLANQIIIKMTRKGYWGHRMINLSDLIKSVPGHLRGKAKSEIDGLVKQRFLNKKPGIKSEFRFSLNLQKKQEIDGMIIKKYTFNV